MAQLKSTVVAGSLRVTDTTYTNDLVISATKTARYVLAAPTSGGAPTFRALTNADVGLGNVENTKLSTWAGTNKITTVGTITSGTWQGTKIAATYLPTASTTDLGTMKVGTGLGVTSGTVSVSYGTAANTALQGNQVLFKLNNANKTASSAAAFYAPTGAGTAGQFLKSTGGAPEWQSILYNDIQPIKSKTYTGVTVTGNSDPAGWLYFFRAGRTSGATYNDIWHLTYKVTAYCATQVDSRQVSIVHIDGVRNTYTSYWVWNSVGNTSYRPFYAHAGYWASNNTNAPSYAPICGLRFQSSLDPTNSAQARTITFDILEQDNCEVTFFDNGILYANVPGTGSTYFNTSRWSFDGTTQGITASGDRNTTSISTLYNQYGGYVAGNLLGRYQLIFETAPAEHKFISVYGTDNAYNTTNKTLLTTDFDPLGRIFYHNAGGTTANGANIDAGRLYYSVLADLRYSFNVTKATSNTTFTGTAYTSLYLKTAMTNNTGMVHVASNQPLVNTLPTSKDGFYYIYLGQVYDWYRVMLSRDHPVFYHNGTSIVRYYGDVAARTITVNDTTASTSTTTGALTVAGGVGVAGQLTAARVGAGGSNTSYALYANGATLLNGKLVGAAANYGETLPTSSLTTGQIFFQTSTPAYELPLAGDTGAYLTKMAANSREASWTKVLTVNSPFTVNRYDANFGGRILLVPGSSYGYNGIIDVYQSTLRLYGAGTATTTGVYVNLTNGVLMGAAWNDYAEFRRDNWREKDKQKPGNCVVETGNGTLALSTKRLQPGAEIITDTYGFAIGEDKKYHTHTPIAVSGRVLAYPYEDRKEFKEHIGRPVCSGPNGTVSIMSYYEERNYPSRIIGTISEVPTYKEWGENKVKVNGRVWIRLR